MLYVRIEVPDGADVREAAAEMCELARRLQAGVATSFCGREMRAAPGDAPGPIIAGYLRSFPAGKA
jgi:hypothetical protein